MKKAILFISAFYLGFSVAKAAIYTPESGDIRFTAIGKPGFLKVRGESKNKFPNGQVKHENDLLNADFEFELKNFDTGIEMRNEHMKDKYLEVGKFPLAKLKIKDLALKEAELKNEFKKNFVGILQLHGVSKEVKGEFVYKPNKKTVIANFGLKVSDFAIEIPKYLGVTVSDMVDVEVNLLLK
jgi:hypothetical protein